MTTATKSKIYRVACLGKNFRVATTFRQSGENFIFFIHGLGCRKESFNDALRFAELDNYSLLMSDLIGFGSSSKPKNFSYSLEEQAEICKILIQRFNANKVQIVGHSMGGAIGLLLAEKIPAKLGLFANVEGNLIGQDCGLLSRKIASVSLKEFKNKTFAELKTVLGPVKNKGVKMWLKWSKEANYRAFYKSAKSLVEWSDSGKLLGKFKDLKTKKTYFYGEENSSLQVLRLLKGIGKVCIPNSGHFVMNDNPKEFYPRLAKLIKQY